MERSLAAAKSLLTRGKDILSSHKQQLKDWTDENRIDLIAHFSTSDRLTGFDRDGEIREEVATQVDSIRGQVDTIRSDRAKNLNGWKATVKSIWDSLEQQVNELYTEAGSTKEPLLIHRPFNQPNAKLKWINWFIPWFDTIVGVLLILGLFTRFASLSAAIFLGSVILSQPAWLPGTKTTYYESVEFFALLVIFATCAGRFGGLDFFLSQKSKKTSTREEN